MSSSVTTASDEAGKMPGQGGSRTDELLTIIHQAAELLPAQGPITAFVFLNTLQALEDLPFDEGVRTGSRLFGCQPYLTENQYRERLEHGRILRYDLIDVLHDDLGARGADSIASLTTRLELRLAMLQYPLHFGAAQELRWFVAETDALTRLRAEASAGVREQIVKETRHWVMRDIRNGSKSSGEKSSPRHLIADQLEHFGEDTIESWTESTWEKVTLQLLWRVCRQGVECVGGTAPHWPSIIRHRDILHDATGHDSDALVHEVLIKFCAAFVDQGFAPWPLPNREEGFFKAFMQLYRQPCGPVEAWMRSLSDELRRIEATGFSPLEVIVESLDLLGVSRGEWSSFIPATLLALRGWAGLLWQTEVRGDRVALPSPAGTLVEFLAVRLVLERLALAHTARQALRYQDSLGTLREAALARLGVRPDVSSEQRAFMVFQLAEILGWCPTALYQLSSQQWGELVDEVESFASFERRRIYHQAFERRYREQALDAISIHTSEARKRVESPRFQAVFCIDTREESFRRHLEETAADAETFSAAGFFGVAIYYKGVADAYYSTLCPIVVRPQHWLIEEVVFSLEEEHQRRARTRRTLGTVTHHLHIGSRSISRGALLTAGLGVLASIPLVARVLFPRLTARIRRSVGQLVAPPPVTRLRLERTAEQPGPDKDQIGFTVDEMANLGERALRDIGLTSSFAPLVFFFGHGSFCLNNPHKSAYDCGACSGGAGGPNARALAAMLNDPRVRAILANRGLDVPRDTYFIGGLHNTCNDTLTYFDLDQLPKTHHASFDAARATLAETCRRNAHERCRRFQSAALNLTRDEAWRHVDGRSEDLAQTRPEFGNASNAMCFVGRRERLRGLYMDRRAFMQSYNPTQDTDEHLILARILGAVVPVCEGINLQYFFSYIDNIGWGCGTKLPHNVTSLLGVMDGHSSDLRSGLPWQGVEIHEPMRLLMIIETTPAGIRKIMDRSPVVSRIIRNGWVQLALLDPDSSQLLVYRNDEFYPYEPTINELPQVSSSIEWYRGWRDHLGFAQVVNNDLPPPS